MNNLVYVFMFRLSVRIYVLTLCSTYVSTESTLCFDFEFDDRTFSTMDFRSTSDMCSTHFCRYIFRKITFEVTNFWRK